MSLISWFCPACDIDNTSEIPDFLSLSKAKAFCSTCACKVRFIGPNYRPVAV